MAYTPFDSSKPATGDTGPNYGTGTRNNFKALRDMIAAGTMFGWTLTPSGGTEAKRAQILMSKGTERIRATLTWGGSGDGGANNNVKTALYEYSSTSGSTYDTIGTITVSYTAAGYWNGSTWA